MHIGERFLVPPFVMFMQGCYVEVMQGDEFSALTIIVFAGFACTVAYNVLLVMHAGFLRGTPNYSVG